MNNYKLAPLLVLLTSVCAFIGWAILPLDMIFPIVHENGPIETMTVIFYFVAIACIWLSKIRLYSTPFIRIVASIAILAFAARELDLHKVIEGVNLLKVRFWIGDSPISYKIMTAAVLVPMIFSILYLLLKFYKPVLNAAMQLVPSAVTLVTFSILIVVTKMIDRSLDVVTQLLSWDSPRWVTALQNSFEESLEMLLPILLIVFIFQKIKEQAGSRR